MKNPVLLFIVTLSAIFVSCRDNTPGDPNNLDVSWTIATFTGNIDGHATFEFRKADDSPIITLTAQGEIETNDNLKPQARVYIAYIPACGDPYSSGSVTLTAVNTITSSDVTVADVDLLKGWDADPVYLLTAWRSGEYLNIYCRIPYDTNPRRFGLSVDETTLASTRPQLYLCHEMAEDVNTFMRSYYASFDISSVMRPDVEAIDLHVNNSNLPVTLYTFPLATQN